MFSIADLLDSAMANAHIESDYRLSKILGISRAAVSLYRVGKTLPNESVIAQLCALSGDDPGVIVAQIQAARSKSPEAKTMWFAIAARLAGGASTAILSVLCAICLIAVGPGEARASALQSLKTANAHFIYIVSNTILSVNAFLLVRLRRFPLCFAFRFSLCMLQC